MGSPPVAESAGHLRFATLRAAPRSLISSTQPKNVLASLLRTPWVTTMRTRVRRFAHVLERIGLAMAGAASGLFVAAHVGSTIAALTSQVFILVMMIAGAVGFYLGIDTPPLAFHGPNEERVSAGGIDAAELLTAIGTFFAAWAAFASVGVIVARTDPHIFWTIMIMLGWVIGVMMQIVAGAIARTRA